MRINQGISLVTVFAVLLQPAAVYSEDKKPVNTRLAVNRWVPIGQVSSATGTKIAVRAVNTTPAATTQTASLKFKPKTGVAVRPPVQGQMVWVNYGTQEAKWVALPATASKKDNLGHSHYMETSVKLTAAGELSGKTRTWSNEALRGFTGGVIVYLLDANNNILFKTPKRTYGVNGEAVPGAKSDRTETWSDSVPTAVVGQTAKIGIVQQNAPDPRWDEFAIAAGEVLLVVLVVLLCLIINGEVTIDADGVSCGPEASLAIRSRTLIWS